jgi:hypothetical protein
MTENPFLGLTPAEIDVLDDMYQESVETLKYDYGYGPKREAALNRLIEMIKEAWFAKVGYVDSIVEEID